MTLLNINVTAFILLAAFAFVTAFALMAQVDPREVVVTLVAYTGSLVGFTEVLVHAIPLTLLGLGTTIALRAGLFNIGGDGQLICGALLAVMLSPFMGGLGWIGLLLFLVAGFLGGSLIGAMVGILRAKFGASEIIVTIMLNYVCIQLASFAIRGPLQEPMRIFPRSFTIPPDCVLPILIDGTRLHAGLVFAVVATAAVAVIFARSALGFRISIIGASRGVPDYIGLRTRALTVTVMALSAGLAGLAGAAEIAGVNHRIEDNFAEGFGLSGIAVAVIARLNPLLVPFTALLFGVFYAGAGALQRQLALPFPLVWILEAVTIFAVALLYQANRRQVAHV